jgi:hypothetical protein
VGGADCIVCGGGGTPGIVAANNHWITTGGMSSIFSAPSAVTETTALYMTPTTAAAQGYTAANNYAPTRTSNSTVTATGANLTSTYCSLLKNAMATEACERGTTDACTYDTSDHTVHCPDILAVARPPTGAWNVGAYECLPDADGGCGGKSVPTPDAGPGDASTGSDAGKPGPDAGRDAGGDAAKNPSSEAGVDAGSAGAGASSGCGCRAAPRDAGDHVAGIFGGLGFVLLMSHRSRGMPRS